MDTPYDRLRRMKGNQHQRMCAVVQMLRNKGDEVSNKRRVFLAQTLPDDHAASKLSKENTSENIPKLTQHYPASDLGSGQECIE